jgi:hypothetical protein
MVEKTCKCKPESFEGNRGLIIPPICDSYIAGFPFQDTVMCQNCLHGENCHEAPAEQEEKR